MSDDDLSNKYGGPLFPDDADDAEPVEDPVADPIDDDTGEHRRLRFGPDDSGPLPHWTDPPTGEVPRLSPRDLGEAGADDDDDVDVWSTFSTESPVWQDDEEDLATGVVPQIDPSGGGDRPPLFDRSEHDTGALSRDPTRGVEPDPSRALPRNEFGPRGDDSGSIGRTGRDPSGSVDRSRRMAAGGVPPRDIGDIGEGFGDPTGSGQVPRVGRRRDPSGEVPTTGNRQPGRITIGTDPSGMPRRNEPPRRRGTGSRGGGRPGSGRPLAPRPTVARPGQRDMTPAIIVAAVMAALFIGSLLFRPAATVVIVVVVLALGAWEYFSRVAEKGYRPAVAVGLAVSVFSPLAAYNWGERAIPLVLFLAFLAAAGSFIGSPGVESGPLPNMATTMLGIMWIGLLGTFAALILRFSVATTAFGDFLLPAGTDVGTDTMFMLALGVAANDIGALAVGSLLGRRPLRAWVSPAKTVEGLLGGTVVTVFALFIASKLADDLNVWTDTKWILLLAVTISIFAPLGDLTESMIKRNLDIKDFGTIIQGHGGVLDRFDGFLFALPATYYLTLLLGATS